MGSNTSRPFGDTSMQKIEADPDPRSPTPEISRTPLQGKAGAKHNNITKNADLRKAFESPNAEEKVTHNNPILSAVIKNHLQSYYDPRSPSTDFERTPLYMASKIEKLAIDNSGSPCLREATEENDHNEKQGDSEVVPKNLCNGFYDLSLNETLKDTDEPLGSSTASNEAIESHIGSQAQNKAVELLETNFEYIETEHEINDEVKNHTESSVDSSFKHIPLFKILNIDPRSPSDGIERTPIVVAKSSEDSCEEQLDNKSDDKLIKVLQDTNIDLRNSVSKSTHEGLLIYEDASNNFLDTPKKPKTGSASGSRTPLSCMKNKAESGHARSKSANTLEDPKGQNKISKPKRMSHIPRLKSLQTRLAPSGSSISLKNISKKTAIGGDCENTPPHSHRDKWDKDNSIVL